MYSKKVKTTDTIGGGRAITVGFVRGIISAFIFMLVVFALFACILAYTDVSENVIPVIATAVQAVSALIAGFYTAKGSGSRGGLFGILSGVGYVFILWFIASLAGDGFYFGKHVISMFLISAFFGAIGGILGVNLKKSRTNRQKR